MAGAAATACAAIWHGFLFVIRPLLPITFPVGGSNIPRMRSEEAASIKPARKTTFALSNAYYERNIIVTKSVSSFDI
jgi:hypothetical protein